MKKILLVGGGTGGHCLPMLSIYKEFKKKNIKCTIVTDFRGISYFSTLPQYDIKLIKNINSSNSRISQLINFPYFFIQSLKLCFNLKVNFAVGFGGFITIPFLLACIFFRIKTVIHEANAIMGRANRFLSFYSYFIFTTFNDTKNINLRFLNKVKCIGMPIRAHLNSDKFYKKNNSNVIRICILGGSQGSKSLSEVVPKSIIKLRSIINKNLFITHQGRESDIKYIKNIYNAFGIKADVSVFFDDMPKRMQYSDVIISRSGSSTTNEIVFYKKPSILIPYPYAIDDHQYYNAKTLSQYSCSTLIRNENLNSTRLTIEIFKSIFVPAKKKYIKSKLSRINSLNSAEKMIQILKLDLNGHK
tara:strand:+ start:3851 stop:4927 length:1077 start_codon:yes stop_codon:yes gene_type:complete